MSQQLYSPDGRWRWDGQRWQPTSSEQSPGAVAAEGAQQPPVMPGQQPYGSSAPGGPPAGWSPYPPAPNKGAPKRGRRALWIGGIALAVVVVLLVAAGLAGGGRRNGTASIPGSGKTLQPGQAVTAQSLASVDPSAFFWSMLKRQLTAPITEVMSVYFQRLSDLSQHSVYNLDDVTVDYTTRKFDDQVGSYVGGKGRLSRCVDGQMVMWEASLNQWTSPHAEKDCTSLQQLGIDSTASDGIAPGGMSGTQAAKYMSALASYQGFVNPSRPQLVTCNGRKYVRMVVDYKPVKLSDGQYWGTMIFTWAFKAAGLDPTSYPFNNSFGGGAGMHVVYYVSPDTLMPSYAKQATTPVLGDNGQPQASDQQTVIYQYAFPATLPSQTTSDHVVPAISGMPYPWTRN